VEIRGEGLPLPFEIRSPISVAPKKWLALDAGTKLIKLARVRLLSRLTFLSLIYMLSFVCVALALIPAILLFQMTYTAVKNHSQLKVIAFGATLCHELILVVFPVIYSVVTNFELEDSMLIDVQPEDLIVVLLGESLFVLLFVVGFVAAQKMFRDRFGLTGKRDVEEKYVRIIYNGLIISAWLVYVYEAFSDPMRLKWYEMEKVGVIEQIRGWLSAILWLPSLIVCALVVTKPGSARDNRLRFLCATVPLIAIVVIGVTTGLRGRFSWVASVIVIGAYLQRNWKFIYFTIAAMLVIMPLTPFMGSEYRYIFQNVSLGGATRGELLHTFANQGSAYVANSEGNNLFNDICGSLAQRAQGPRNSVVLYREYDSGKRAGLGTLVGALVFPVPRMVYPDKPMPGSLSSSVLDGGIYLVMTLGQGAEGIMGPMLASASAYWEGGWMWLVLAGLLTGIFWSLLITWAESYPLSISVIVVVCFTGALLIDGLFTMLAPVYSIILQIWLCLIPFLIILGLVGRKASQSKSKVSLIVVGNRHL